MYRGEKPEVSKANQWFAEHFPSGSYEDIEGLCKIVDLEEVKENDYSLTPGRYVGFSIYVDEVFDYNQRLNEIQNKIDELSGESVNLTSKIASWN